MSEFKIGSKIRIGKFNFKCVAISRCYDYIFYYFDIYKNKEPIKLDNGDCGVAVHFVQCVDKKIIRYTLRNYLEEFLFYKGYLNE